MKIHCAQLVEGALRSALEPAAESKPAEMPAQATGATLLDSISKAGAAGGKITFLKEGQDG
jgi:hypothetical protein